MVGLEKIVMNQFAHYLVSMVNAQHRIHAHARLVLPVKHVNFRKVSHCHLIDVLSMDFSSDDPRLVRCYRKADCGKPSRIGNASMSISHCCKSQGGLATSASDKSCTPCSVNDEIIANASEKMRRTLNYATCLLWGRDHIRTFDGLFYDFQGR